MLNQANALHAPLFSWKAGQGLPDNLSFTGDATRTYFDASGILHTTAANVPRAAAYSRTSTGQWLPGWLIEGPRTNTALWSRDLTNAVWSRGGTLTVTQNAVGLDGTTNSATTVADADAAGFGSVARGFAIADDNAWHTASFWVAKDTDQTRCPQFKLNLIGGTTHQQCGLSLNTATGQFIAANTIGTNHTVNVYDMLHWWWVVISVQNNTAGNTTASVEVLPAARAVFNGGDVAATTGSIVVGQVQLELNATFASSPILTTSTAVTRAGELASVPWGFPPSTDITVYSKHIERGTVSSVSNTRLWNISTPGGNAKRIDIDTSGSHYRFVLSTGTTGLSATLSSAAPALGDSVELCASLSDATVGTLTQSVNGGAFSTATASLAITDPWPSPTLFIGGDGVTTQTGFAALQELTIARGVKPLDAMRTFTTPTTSTFSSDQVQSAVVDTWDTPFTPLESDVASAGLPLDVYQPDGTTPWATYASAVASATTANLATTFAQNAEALVTNGRVPNLYESWGAGAPAWYGVEVAGQVALHYHGVLRSVAGRSWFADTTAVTMSLALAGSGFVRLTKTVSGVTSEVNIHGTAGYSVSEQDFLDNGLQFTDVFTLNPGDALDLYYVQNGEVFGGLVAKAILGDASQQTLATAQTAPVLGCGLFDDGSAPSAYTLPVTDHIEVTFKQGQAFTAVVDLPLINSDHHDGFGYEYAQATGDEEQVNVWYGGAVQHVLKKGRLIRIALGDVDAETIVFTGLIKDFGIVSGGKLPLECLSFEHRLLESHTKNEPDELSYMCAGYQRTVTTSEPVYNVTAYDAWTMEAALADMLYKSGVDASRVMAPLRVPTTDGSLVRVTYNGEAYTTFRARNVLGKPLRLERPVHYGNDGSGFSDLVPVDDAYKFPPENLKELWYRARDLADRYGYDLRFNALGNVSLSTRANPCFVYDADITNATNSAASLKTHPSAFSGTYIELSGTQAPTVTFTVTGARIDLALPRGPSLGGWSSIVVTRVSDGVVMETLANVDVSAATDEYYYDFRLSPDGENDTLFTVYTGVYDTYTVMLTPTASGTADGAVRRVDCAFVYHTDPLTSVYPVTLRTDANALDIVHEGSSDEQRNLVYVVGTRKTTATDSEKLKTNPNNPDPEFIVSVSVDRGSITDPNATNYLGLKREALIVDPSIGDQDYADYLSRTVIYRYRVAKPPAQIRHTLLPIVEPRDPVTAQEVEFNTVQNDRTLFVVGYTHVYDRGGYTTVLDTSAFPEFPSYEVRSDIDIDAHFNGLPVTNVEVSYTSLTGHVQTNRPSTGVVKLSPDDATINVTVPVTAGTPEYLDLTGQSWPPIPGTVFLGPPNSGTQGPLTVDAPTSPTPTSPSLKSQLARYFAPQSVNGNTVVTLPLGNVSIPGIRSVSNVTNVTVTVWRSSSSTEAVKDRVLVVPSTAVSDSSFPIFWTVDLQTSTLTMRAKASPTLWGVFALFGNKPELYLSYEVHYTPGEQGDVSTTVTNTPYHHFMNIDYRDTNKRIYLPWKQGDGTAPYQRNSSVTSYNVSYRPLFTSEGDYASGISPFYDPYTSQLTNLVQLQFDALVSGNYRISVRNADEPDTIVAYLTEPTADATQPEAHWQYLTAGAEKQFYWDGVDQVGQWNLEQSAEVAQITQGAFDATDPQPIGAGFYAWNQERSAAAAGGPGPLALISGERDAVTGKPVFPVSTFSRWFFQVECKNDDLAELDIPLPRVAKTIESDSAAPIYTTEGATAALVYMHLPDPTRVDLLVDDWLDTVTYDPADATKLVDQTGTYWGAADADATINTAKPVRLRFRVAPRPGVLWTGKQGEVDVQLTRQAHPKVVVFDQVLVSEGTYYSTNNLTSSVEERTLYTRSFENNANTLEWQDAGYRKAKSFVNPDYPNGTAVWVFTPDLIKKNFRGIENESLQFADYLQLEELPNWNPNQGVGTPRSRYLIGFMAYLLYLSAYTQDRSGRRVWATNRSFLDQSKIANNSYSDWWDPASPGTPATSTTFQAELPPDPTRQFARSIICRQWAGEPGWADAETTRYTLSGTVGATLLEHDWADHEPGATTLGLAGAAWPTLSLDEHSKWHTDSGAGFLGLGTESRTQLPTTFSNLTRQLGDTTSTALRAWTWETGPQTVLWVPCVTRDWFPHFVVPPMADAADWDYYGDHLIYATVDTTTWGGGTKNTGRDIAKQPTWQSWVRDMTEAYNPDHDGLKRFTVGSSVDPNHDPNKPPPANVFNYVRQRELTTYETLRGIYTRGPRPSEGPKKLSGGDAYYHNQLRYAGLRTQTARNQKKIPDTYAVVSQWFRLSFRAEYLYESATLFPVDQYNREYLEAFNLARTHRALPSATVFYDGGAWTGWKDDLLNTTSIVAEFTESAPNGFVPSTTTNVFATGRMPVAVGPELPVTKRVLMHLVLLNDRRETPID